MNSKNTCKECPINISETDILEAMAAMDGYIDITPADFMEVYKISYQHAVERLSQTLTAKDVMSWPVIHTRPDALLLDVAGIMAENNVTGLPVIDDSSHVVGVISEKDFLREMGIKENQSFMSIVVQCLRNKGCMAIPLRNRKVQDIMSSPAVTVPLDTHLSVIAVMFNEKKINRVPVVDHQLTLCGIVTRSDIVQSHCA